MWKDICHVICMTISQMLTSADKGDSKLIPHWLVFYLRKLIQLSMFKKQQVTYENLGFCLLIKKSCLEARELHDDRQQHHRAMQPFFLDTAGCLNFPSLYTSHISSSFTECSVSLPAEGKQNLCASRLLELQNYKQGTCQLFHQSVY